MDFCLVRFTKRIILIPTNIIRKLNIQLNTSFQRVTFLRFIIITIIVIIIVVVVVVVVVVVIILFFNAFA